MEEKILVKSEQYHVKKLFKIMVIIGAVLSAILLFNCVAENVGYYDRAYENYLDHQGYDCNWRGDGKCGFCKNIIENPTKIGFVLLEMFDFYDLIIWITPVASVV